VTDAGIGVAKRLGIVALGYLAAVAAAVTVTVVLIVFGFTPYPSLEDLLIGAYLGFIFTFPSALPGFVVVVIVATWLGWNSWIGFALAGALNAVSALVIIALYTSGNVGWAPAMLLPCALGGFMGGFAYWAVAVRRLEHSEAVT
jgi:hypothetical protein